MSATRVASPEVVYPDSDGQPMADNTVQYEWIETIKGGLDALFRDRPDVFVAADHLIYPVRGKPKVRQAPDVYVAFGRPKGHRGSYKVWEEDGLFPQVVFEVLSPRNWAVEMARKLLFYERYGAEEYYVYDPARAVLSAYRRRPDGRFDDIDEPDGHISPRLGVKFDLSGPELVIRRANGDPLRTYVGEAARGDEAERQRQEAERQRDSITAEAARLRELLRRAGIDPDAAG